MCLHQSKHCSGVCLHQRKYASLHHHSRLCPTNERVHQHNTQPCIILYATSLPSKRTSAPAQHTAVHHPVRNVSAQQTNECSSTPHSRASSCTQRPFSLASVIITSFQDSPTPVGVSAPRWCHHFPPPRPQCLVQSPGPSRWPPPPAQQKVGRSDADHIHEVTLKTCRYKAPVTWGSAGRHLLYRSGNLSSPFQGMRSQDLNVSNKDYLLLLRRAESRM